MSLEDRSRGEEHASATSNGAHMTAWGATSKGATDVAATRTTAVAAESMTAVTVFAQPSNHGNYEFATSTGDGRVPRLQSSERKTQHVQ